MSYAFVDLDGTLVRIRTMFDFERFFLNWKMRSNRPQHQIPWREAGASGLGSLDALPREEANRLFYRRFAHRSRWEILTAREAWWCESVQRSQAFVQETVEVLSQLRREQFEPVIVSGSCLELVEPFANHLGIRTWLATNLELRNGYYTGRYLHAPMIGEGKRLAVETFLAARGGDASKCIAIGDHISDAPMLAAVGYAYVVAGDAALMKLATENGWRVIGSGAR